MTSYRLLAELSCYVCSSGVPFFSLVFNWGHRAPEAWRCLPEGPPHRHSYNVATSNIERTFPTQVCSDGVLYNAVQLEAWGPTAFDIFSWLESSSMSHHNYTKAWLEGVSVFHNLLPIWRYSTGRMIGTSWSSKSLRFSEDLWWDVIQFWKSLPLFISVTSGHFSNNPLIQERTPRLSDSEWLPSSLHNSFSSLIISLLNKYCLNTWKVLGTVSGTWQSPCSHPNYILAKRKRQ